MVTVKPGSEVVFKTASGELVPSDGTGTFIGFGESGMKCRVQGAVSDVHKPLISAHKCLGHGRIAVLDADGGQLVPLESKAGRAIQRILTKASVSETKTWMPVYQERGVYNFYLRRKVDRTTSSMSAVEVHADLNASSAAEREPQGRADPPEEPMVAEEELEEVVEAERPVQIRAPEEPTPAEIEEHESMGHVQYRDWCRHCIAGRAVGQPHRTRSEEQRAKNVLPTVSFDYAFMSRGVEEDDERLRPILVMKDDKTLLSMPSSLRRTSSEP